MLDRTSPDHTDYENLSVGIVSYLKLFWAITIFGPFESKLVFELVETCKRLESLKDYFTWN